MKRKLLLVLTYILLCSVGFAQSGANIDLAKRQPQVGNFPKSVDNEEKSVSVYPNPSNGMVYITLSGFKGKRTELRVMNVIGNVIHREILTDNETTRKDLNLSNLASGLYYIKLQTNDYSEIRKIIIN